MSNRPYSEQVPVVNSLMETQMKMDVDGGSRRAVKLDLRASEELNRSAVRDDLRSERSGLATAFEASDEDDDDDDDPFGRLL